MHGFDEYSKIYLPENIYNISYSNQRVCFLFLSLFHLVHLSYIAIKSESRRKQKIDREYNTRMKLKVS